jgi:hypothetical protein
VVMYSEIAARVRAALTQDSRTVDLSIEVIDENGLVTLSGEVDSEEARQLRRSPVYKRVLLKLSTIWRLGKARGRS